MRNNHSAVLRGLLGTVLLTSAVRAQEESLPSLPDSESTVEKVTALSEGLQTLRRLQATLKNLGSPIVKEPGESNEQFLHRVDLILKGRAYAVTLIGQQMERALDARFQLQEELAQYEEWAEAVDAQLKLLPESYRRQREKLEQDFAAARPDGIVLAWLLYEENKESDPEAARDYQPHFDSVDPVTGKTLIDSISDADTRAEKFSAMTTEEKQAAFEKTINKLVDAEFEIELLNKVVILEAEGFRDILPKEHQEAIGTARSLLKDNEDLRSLDDRAAQVAIIAKYTSQNLNLVQPGRGISGLVDVLQNLKTSEPIVQEVMQELFTGDLPVRGRRSIMLRTPLPPQASTTDDAATNQ